MWQKPVKFCTCLRTTSFCSSFLSPFSSLFLFRSSLLPSRSLLRQWNIRENYFIFTINFGAFFLLKLLLPFYLFIVFRFFVIMINSPLLPFFVVAGHLSFNVLHSDFDILETKENILLPMATEQLPSKDFISKLSNTSVAWSNIPRMPPENKSNCQSILAKDTTITTTTTTNNKL